MNLSSYRSALKDLHRFNKLALTTKSGGVSVADDKNIDRSSAAMLSSSTTDMPLSRTAVSGLSGKIAVEVDITTNQVGDHQIYCTDKEGKLYCDVQQMLDKCQKVADMSTYLSNQNFQSARSLCLLLLDKETGLRLFPTLGEAIDIRRNVSTVSMIKVWSYSALGLLLLKELIIAVSKFREKIEDSKIRHENEEWTAEREKFQCSLKDLVIENIFELLEHSESRIRSMCSEILCLIAQNERTDYEALKCKMGHKVPAFDTFSDETKLKSILLETEVSSTSHQRMIIEPEDRKSLESKKDADIHFPLYHSVGLSLLIKVQKRLCEERSTASRPTNLGDMAFIALDDTTGGS